MTFDEYQKQALTTAIINPDPDISKAILVLGITGEAGEVAEKWKKILAYNDGKVTDEDKTEISKELGDVLWYIAVFAHDLGLSLEDVVQQNVQKLMSRKERQVLKGQGDNR